MRIPVGSKIIRGGRDLRQDRPLALPRVKVLEHSAQGFDGDVGVDGGGLQALMAQLALDIGQDVSAECRGGIEPVGRRGVPERIEGDRLLPPFLKAGRVRLHEVHRQGVAGQWAAIGVDEEGIRCTPGSEPGGL